MANSPFQSLFASTPYPSEHPQLPVPVKLAMELLETSKFRLLAQGNADGVHVPELTTGEAALNQAACDVLRNFITGEHRFGADPEEPDFVRVPKAELQEAISAIENRQDIDRVRRYLRTWLLVTGGELELPAKDNR